jgi:hypothetical protein
MSAPPELDFVDIEWVRSIPTMSFPSLVEEGGETGGGESIEGKELKEKRRGEGVCTRV